MDLLKLIPRTDIKVAYDYSHAESTYIYGLAPNTVLAGAGASSRRSINELQRGTLDGRYFITRRLALGAGLLVRQVPRRRLRAGPGRQPGAAGDRRRRR